MVLYLQKSSFGYYWLFSGFQIVLVLLAFGGTLLISYIKLKFLAMVGFLLEEYLMVL